jgi:DNA polymerase-1
MLKPLLACDIETDSLEPTKIHCIAFHNEYIHICLEWDVDAAAQLSIYLSEYTLVFHNASFDVSVLRSIGQAYIPQGSYLCTQVLAHAINPQLPSYSLDNLSCGGKIDYKTRMREIHGDHLTDAQVYALPFSPIMEEYCLQDTALTWQLMASYQKHLLADENLYRTYHTILVPFIEVVISMKRGINIDGSRMVALLTKVTEDINSRTLQFLQDYPVVAKLTWDKVNRQWTPTGKTSSPNLKSPNDVNSLLFGAGWVPTEFNRDTGRPVTDQSVLQRLIASETTAPQLRTLVKSISDIRQLTGIQTQCVTILTKLATKKTLVLNADWHQTGTVTHRLSSSNPNLQNLAVRFPIYGPEMRACFIPPPNHSMIVGDLAQIELAILAYYLELLVNDSSMAEAARAGKDFHSSNTTNWFNLPPDDPEFKRYRAKCKNGIFATNYGASAPRLSLTLNIPLSEAREIIRTVEDNIQVVALKNIFWGVLSSTRDIHPVWGRTAGFFYDCMGVRHFYPDILSTNRTKESSAKRASFNCLMQGGCFSIFATLLNRLFPFIRDCGGWVASTVHDEVIIIVPTMSADHICTKANDVFRYVLPTPQGGVPVLAEFNIVDNWSQK